VFYFQQLLNTALAGIDGTAIISTVTNFAFAILLIGFLISGGVSRRRSASPGGNGRQVSDRCHDHV